MIKYFIENTKFRKWYVFAFRFEIKTTSQYQKPSLPSPIESDFWTNDPLRAMSFNSQQEAEKFINETNKIAKEKGWVVEIGLEDYAGWNLINCIVTEHEFI